MILARSLQLVTTIYQCHFQCRHCPCRIFIQSPLCRSLSPLFGIGSAIPVTTFYPYHPLSARSTPQQNIHQYTTLHDGMPSFRLTFLVVILLIMNDQRWVSPPYRSTYHQHRSPKPLHRTLFRSPHNFRLLSFVCPVYYTTAELHLLLFLTKTPFLCSRNHVRQHQQHQRCHELG